MADRVGPADPRAMSGRDAPVARRRVVPAALVDARREAERCLAAARAEADRIVRRAHAEADGLRAQAAAEGREHGWAEHTEHTLARLRALERAQRAVLPDLATLVRGCVEHLLQRELIQEPTAVLERVRAALAAARRQGALRLELHPEDLAIARAHRAGLVDALDRADVLDLRPDPSLRRGDCRVETPLATVEVSLERQLDAMARALAEPDPSDPDAGRPDQRP